MHPCIVRCTDLIDGRGAFFEVLNAVSAWWGVESGNEREREVSLLLHWLVSKQYGTCRWHFCGSSDCFHRIEIRCYKSDRAYGSRSISWYFGNADMQHDPKTLEA